MAVFSKQQLLLASPSQVPQIAENIRLEFEKEGYEVKIDTLMSGGSDISITKGSIFKAVLGMRTALNVTLTPQADGVLFDAGVGIFGQQAIPTVISMFFFWPVLLTQLWGLIQQSSLDDRALAAAEQAIAGGTSTAHSASSFASSYADTPKFCTNCGTKTDGISKFCPECGTKLG